MKILYIASVRIPNEKASGLAIMRQCEAFARHGHSVTLLRPYRKNHIVEELFDYYGMEKNFDSKTMTSFDYYPALGLFGFACARLSQMILSFIEVLKRRDEVDIIYTRDPWMVMLVLFFKVRKKIVFEAHKTYSSSLVTYVINNSSLVICITNGLREEYTKLTGRQNIHVEPSGVDLTQFKCVEQNDVLRTRYRIPTSKKVVGYVGKYTTMGEGKGVDDLVCAFAELHRSQPDTHLLIVGLEQSEIVFVESMCRTVGLMVGEFTLLPLVQKDFASYLQVADVLVMNYPDTEHYRTYMSPTKLFAYMGSNKIVVASDLPSVREIVDESMVLFVKSGDYHALQETLLRALEEDQTLIQMRKKALVQVQKFTWEHRAARIIDRLS